MCHCFALTGVTYSKYDDIVESLPKLSASLTSSLSHDRIRTLHNTSKSLLPALSTSNGEEKGGEGGKDVHDTMQALGEGRKAGRRAGGKRQQHTPSIYT